MGAAPRSAPVRALVVDDDDLVRESFVSILAEEGYTVESARSASEAMERLRQAPFDAMLCDIFMPGRNGLDLLKDTQSQFPELPVILVTAYGDAAMARQAVRFGASDFITKPCNRGELPIVIERNLERHAASRRLRQRNREAVFASHESVLNALLIALDTRDTETEGHSERVTAYTIELAERLGVSAADMYHIERGALLHDIGKIGIPDRILYKPGRLTPDEWRDMRRHPLIGFNMCSRVSMLREASLIVLHHHEAWDGSGYPDGLVGEAIPLGARIFAVADALDAMTSDRPYRKAMPFAEARAEIERCRSRQFDPSVVDMFLSLPERRWMALREIDRRQAAA